MTASDRSEHRPEQAVLPIEAHGVTKRYAGVPAVDGVDLTVRTGDVYGFLGPNGAGKTTMLRLMLGLVRPDGGTVRLFGADPTTSTVAALTGVAGIIEEPRLYPYLTGRANLDLLAAFDRSGAGRAEVDEVLELVELSESANDRVHSYSQGQRQRLGVASCLIRRPRLLLLDEPANGMDPGGIRFLRDLIRRLAAEGVTVFLSSHLLAEVQAMCNRVAVINTGRVLYEGTIADLAATAAPTYRLTVTDLARAAQICAHLPQLRGLRVTGEHLTFSFSGDHDTAHGSEDDTVALTRALAGAGVGITGLNREQANLEGLFFRLTEPEKEPVP